MSHVAATSPTCAALSQKNHCPPPAASSTSPAAPAEHHRDRWVGAIRYGSLLHRLHRHVLRHTSRRLTSFSERRTRARSIRPGAVTTTTSAPGCPDEPCIGRSVEARPQVAATLWVRALGVVSRCPCEPHAQCRVPAARGGSGHFADDEVAATPCRHPFPRTRCCAARVAPAMDSRARRAGSGGPVPHACRAPPDRPRASA